MIQRAGRADEAQWKWQTERWTQPRPKPHRDRGSCSPPYRGEVRPRAATARAKHLSYGVHLVISTCSFSPSHTIHVRTWGRTSTSTACPHPHVLHVVSNTTTSRSVSWLSEQVYLSSVLRWCHAPEHHARSPAPARPASLLLHDAPAHVPPALTITHQRSGERRGPHLKMCLCLRGWIGEKNGCI